jgi:hypothetical protein
MSDFSSALPIRSELVGQVVYQDIITKLGDATNPTTQQAKVDTFGNQYSVIGDSAGNLIGDQLLSASYWFQVVMPANGPSAPGTASAYSVLAGGVYNSAGETLTNGQQSALQLTSTGALEVSAVQSGTWTVQQGSAPWSFVGTLTNNNAAPAANNFGALVAIAEGTVNAARYTSGDQVLLVTDLAGNTNMDLQYYLGAAVSKTNPIMTTISDGTNSIAAAISAYGTAPVGTDVMGVNAYITNTVPVTLPYDTNWGTVDATTLRVAAEVGNATGAADFNYGTVGAQTLRVAAELGNATGALDYNNGATDAQTLRVAANLAVAGANVTSANPVPVTIVSTTAGTAIQDYHTSVGLAAGASVTFTYTVVATHTFNLERVWSSSAVKIKSLVQNNGTTIFVGFSSTANPNIDMTVVVPPLIAAGNTVTVTITNLDLVASDVYCTIEGNQN